MFFILHMESDDHAMDVRLVERLVVPAEHEVCEVNDRPRPLEHRFPHRGDGFALAAMRGSESNDPFCVREGRVETVTNRCGGILGGITTGGPIVLRAALKPTPSIAKEQDTVNLKTMDNARIVVPGRHDPCIVRRAVPAVEAAMAVAILDALLEQRKYETVMR